MEYIEGYPVLGGLQNNCIFVDVLFTHIIANKVNVGEGITMLEEKTFDAFRDKKNKWCFSTKYHKTIRSWFVIYYR